MKKLKKLAIKKVTLRDLDEPSLDAVAGAITGTCIITICYGQSCPNCPQMAAKTINTPTCHTICSTLCHTC
jgi:hypothetical protein